MMEVAELNDYLRSKPGAVEDFPFGPQPRVFKVGGKMFALVGETSGRVSLKCDPLEAGTLRDLFAGVEPARHLSKKHWNSVLLASDVPPAQLRRMVDHSYELVVRGLPRAAREALPGS